MDDGISDAFEALWAFMREADFWQVPLGEARSLVSAVACAGIRAGVTPARLLLLLKDRWAELPEVSRAEARYLADERRDRLVAMCIDEYFDHASTATQP